MTQLTNKKKKDWAKMLYLNEHLTQKEVAERVGISTRTMSVWVNKEKWDTLKTSMTITREQQLANLYRQVAAINEAITGREEGKRFASSKEADIINKLATAIDKMERDSGLSEAISISKKILKWLRPINPTQAKDLSYVFDSFIKDTLNEAVR
jgi:Transcriptional regulator, contains sigma factor-related N-terminal domain